MNIASERRAPLAEILLINHAPSIHAIGARQKPPGLKVYGPYAMYWGYNKLCYVAPKCMVQMVHKGVSLHTGPP